MFNSYRKARNSCLSHACVLKICFPPSKCSFQEVMPMSCLQLKSPSKCSWRVKGNARSMVEPSPKLPKCQLFTIAGKSLWLVQLGKQPGKILQMLVANRNPGNEKHLKGRIFPHLFKFQDALAIPCWWTLLAAKYGVCWNSNYPKKLDQHSHKNGMRPCVQRPENMLNMIFANDLHNHELEASTRELRSKVQIILNL